MTGTRQRCGREFLAASRYSPFYFIGRPKEGRIHRNNAGRRAAGGTGQTGGMVTVRQLDAGEWPLWRAVRLAALAEAPEAFKARLADWDHGGEARWRARWEHSGGCHVVALRDGRAIGMACGLPAQGDTGGEGGVRELRSVWVGPEGRGRGVADRLLATVEEWARRSGGTRLRLAVLPGNAPALALYRRHGFVATDEPGELLSDGVTRERVLAKTLRPGAYPGG